MDAKNITVNLEQTLDSHKILLLQNALNFFHVQELKSIAEKFSLPDKGSKGVVIDRILHFVITGEIKLSQQIPQISCAKKNESYPLKPDTLILKGSYKNDLKTRLFFRNLIGKHFHFTAFGIDFINERWISGNPPTYQEFANMWSTEYKKRKHQTAKPKQEWAYINFTQKFIRENPKASRLAIVKAWEEERNKQLEIVKKLLGTVNKGLQI